VLAKFVPVWPESAVQEANGQAPDTFVGVDAVNVDAQATPAASVPTAARSATAVTRLLALMNHPPWLQCTLAPIASPRTASEEIRAQMEAELPFARRRRRKLLRAVVARLLGRKP